MKIQHQAPYYDDYDPSKGYTQILAVPGNAEQAREFTQTQTILRDMIERVGNGIFKEGSILEGCNCLIASDKQSIRIQPGRLFLGGLVRIIDEEVELVIDGVGVEAVTAKINYSIVSEIDDESLRDPAQAYENYNQPGATRMKEEVAFSINDNSEGSAIIFTLVEGEILKEITSSDYFTQINDTLARRTYDENGNYKVSGLNLREKADQNYADKVAVSATQGKAYINGYEVEKSAFSTILLDEASEKRSIVAEPKIYSSTIDKYYFNYAPVFDVDKLICLVQVTAEGKQRLTGGVGGADALDHTPVVDILEVTAGDTTYTKNVDYKLYNDQVDWSLFSAGSKEPTVGSTYHVTYTYNKEMEKGVDFDISSDELGYYIYFLGDDNDIVESSSFTADYDFYLARRDLILMDEIGQLSSIKGKPERFGYLITPYNMDIEKLELGYVDIQPNSKEVAIYNYKTERMTQMQMYNLSRRIDDMEYNQAIEDLDNEAAEGESATSLKGIYTDGFIGVSKCDLDYNNGADDKFDCCIDYDLGELALPVETESSTVTLDTSGSNIGVVGRVVSAPFEHELALSQMLATDTMLVNPYASYNPIAKVVLDPAIDNWMNTETVKIFDKITNTTYTTSRNTVSSWATFGTHRYGSLQSSSTSNKVTGTTVTESTAISTTVEDSMIEFMRVKDLDIIGDSFEGGEDNIECFFNEVKIPMTPVGTSLAGTNTGSMSADLTGSFKAKITIPEDTPCGSVAVDLRGPISSGKAIYTAEGVLQTTTIKTTTTTTTNHNVLVTTKNVYENDPLAQTFVFSEDTVLTKLGLYFSAKDRYRPLVIQVRDVINGYPGDTILAEVLVASDQVNSSEDASVKTEVVLNQPVYCKSNTYYSFVIMSDSNAYAMYYAELAKNKLGTEDPVTSNPYPAGVMFSSSNSSTWTAHQACDLKFELYKANYTGNGEIIFSDVTTSYINGLMLAAEYVDYKNAGIDWFYREDATKAWLPLDTYVQRELNDTSELVQLKAELNVKYQTSPFLASDCINLVGFIHGKKGMYISKSIELDTEYTGLKVQYQLASPAGTTCRVFYKVSAETDADWIELVQAEDSYEQVESSASYDNSIIYYELNDSMYQVADVDSTNFTDKVTAGIYIRTTAVTLDTKKVNEEFNEYSWEVANITPASGSKFYKVKVQIETTNIFNRPRVRKLRSILRY